MPLAHSYSLNIPPLSGATSTVQSMKDMPELWHNKHWRVAVVALRVGYAALIVGLIGLVMTLFGATPYVLAGAVLSWLCAGALTSTEFFLTRSDLPEPRPGFWPMRWALIHDSVHAQPSTH
jgi:hypothetical protein